MAKKKKKCLGRITFEDYNLEGVIKVLQEHIDNNPDYGGLYIEHAGCVSYCEDECGCKEYEIWGTKK